MIVTNLITSKPVTVAKVVTGIPIAPKAVGTVFAIKADYCCKYGIKSN